MDFKEAYELAKENEDIEKSLEQGYYLNAGIGVGKSTEGDMRRWIITFYSPDEEEVVQAIIKDENNIQFKPSAEAMDPSTQELDLDKVNITAKKALQIAKEETGDMAKGVSQVLVNLKSKEDKITWEVNLITTSLTLYRVDVDADEGEVLDTEMNTLVKEGSEALPFA